MGDRPTPHPLPTIRDLPRATAAIGQMIDDLELLSLSGEPEEQENRVIFIPFPEP
jgi:hypothetical protein